MTVEVLYVKDCPNVEPLLARIEEVMRIHGFGGEIQTHRVDSERAAQSMHFLGSPTVRVDGRDVEAGAQSRVDFGLGCRLYRVADGVVGAPPDSWIEAALRQSSTTA